MGKQGASTKIKSLSEITGPLGKTSGPYKPLQDDREEIKALLLLSLGPLSGLLLMLPSPVRKQAILESQQKDAETTPCLSHTSGP